MSFSGGNGSASDPYIVATPANARAMFADWTSRVYYSVVSDIDMSGEGVLPNMNGAYSNGVVIEGNGHIIFNLHTAIGRAGSWCEYAGYTLRNLHLKIMSGRTFSWQTGYCSFENVRIDYEGTGSYSIGSDNQNTTCTVTNFIVTAMNGTLDDDFHNHSLTVTNGYAYASVSQFTPELATIVDPFDSAEYVGLDPAKWDFTAGQIPTLIGV